MQWQALFYCTPMFIFICSIPLTHSSIEVFRSFFILFRVLFLAEEIQCYIENLVQIVWKIETIVESHSLSELSWSHKWQYIKPFLDFETDLFTSSSACTKMFLYSQHNKVIIRLFSGIIHWFTAQLYDQFGIVYMMWY